MSDKTKYSPLEGEDADLPAYEPAEATINQVGNAPVEPMEFEIEEDEVEAENPSLVAFFKNVVSKIFQVDFDKAYSFKVRSHIIEARNFRFNYPPRNGFEKLKKYIQDKLHYTLNQEIPLHTISIGYEDESRLLISITTDNDLLECTRYFAEKKYRFIKLHVFETGEHLTLAKKLKKRHHKEIAAICVGFGILFTFLVVFFVKLFTLA